MLYLKIVEKVCLSLTEILLLNIMMLAHFGNTETQLFLLETAKYIPMDPMKTVYKILFDYVISMTNKRSSILRLSALRSYK